LRIEPAAFAVQPAGAVQTNAFPEAVATGVLAIEVPPVPEDAGAGAGAAAGAAAEGAAWTVSLATR
jgi:hypothetical protein